MMKPYPIFLNDLDQRRCIVIGGGEEAARKVIGLLVCSADVTVIAHELSTPLQEIVDAGKVQWIPRHYQQGDLRGAFLVTAEREDPVQNAAIYAEAISEKALVNVMDDVEHCNYVAGSVIRRGPLVIAISTSGAAPAYSVRIRQRLEKEFSDANEEYLNLLNSLREPLAHHYFCFRQRRPIWYTLVDSPLLQLIESGDVEAQNTLLQELVGKEVVTLLEATTPLESAESTHLICDIRCRAPLSVTQCPAKATK